MKECISCRRAFDAADWKCPGCGYHPATIEGRLAFAPESSAQSEGFKPEYFDQLFKLEACNFWFRGRNRLILWALRMYCAPLVSFLEIGCGTGYVLTSIEKAFPGSRLSGSEVYSSGLAYAARRIISGELFQMDARNMPFREEFDVVGAFDVLEHIEDDEVVLRQIHKALKVGGAVIATVPQHDFLWSYVDEYSHHVRRYSSKDLLHKAERSGFQIVRMTSFVSLLLPLLFLSRARVPNDRASFDPAMELSIKGWKNTVLEQAMSVERGMIRLGLNFPVGGSLLMIARKKQS